VVVKKNFAMIPIDRPRFRLNRGNALKVAKSAKVLKKPTSKPLVLRERSFKQEEL
jgi:hypothetical protein